MGYNNLVSVILGFGNKGIGLFSGFMLGFGNMGFLQLGFGNFEVNFDNNSVILGFGNFGKQDFGGFNLIDFVLGFFYCQLILVWYCFGDWVWCMLYLEVI